MNAPARAALAWRVLRVCLPGLLAAAAFIVLMERGGRIQINDGQGWDGAYYAAMTREGLGAGTVNTRLRPLVPMLNRVAYRILGNEIAAYELMNVVYAGLFAVCLGLILDHYGARPAAKALFIATAAVSIATAQMMAFYPLVIDLGAYAVIAGATAVVLMGPRWAVAVACILAVLSREFGIAVVVFAVCRDLRLRTAPWRVAASYLPALVAFFALRTIVVALDPRDAALELLTSDRLLANLRVWQDPFFAGLFLYFAVTVLGGVSVALASRVPVCAGQFRREPEWLVFVAFVVAATAVGSADLWRYLAFLAPVMAMLFARVEAAWAGWPRIGLYAGSIALTWFTQRPFGPMDVGRYFTDWFPYYAVLDQLPRGVQVQLWPAWGWRFVAAAAGVLLLSALADRAPHLTAPARRELPS